MVGICVSAIAALKLFRGTEFNWINDEFLSCVDRVEEVGEIFSRVDRVERVDGGIGFFNAYPPAEGCPQSGCTSRGE